MRVFFRASPGYGSRVQAFLILAMALGSFEARAQHALRIGADNSRPFHAMEDGGKPSGIATEILNEAARRAGIELVWTRTKRVGAEALLAGEADLWPAIAAAPAVPGVVVSDPWIDVTYAVLSVTPLEDAKGRGRLLLIGAAADLTKDDPLLRGFALIPATSREESVSAVCRGEAAGIVLETPAAHALALDRPAGCGGLTLMAYSVGGGSRGLGIAARGESWRAAASLRERIHEMTADGTVDRLLERWSGLYRAEIHRACWREFEQRRTRFLRCILAGALFVFCAALAMLGYLFRTWKQAAAAGEAKRRFLHATDASLRAPLTGILARCEMLAALGADREAVSVIRESGSAMLSTVDRVLALSRPQDDTRLGRPEEFDPRQLIEEIEAIFRAAAAAKGLGFSARVSPAVPTALFGPADQIRFCIEALVDNGIKFTQAGQVSVGMSPAGRTGWVRVDVMDTGSGVKPETADFVFEPFMQGDSSATREVGGMGLGLAVAHRYLTAMGGDIHMDREVKSGAHFWFEAPLPGAGQARV